MAEERVAGGLRCGEVLSLLSDYIDGEASLADSERIESHLRGCDVCERFGGVFSETVAALRRMLADPAGIDEGVASRLRRRLESERSR